MLTPGYYANIFEVRIEGEEIEVFTKPNTNQEDIKSLKEEININGKKVQVYKSPNSNLIIGFGTDSGWLKERGFTLSRIKFLENPHIASKMIRDAIFRKATSLGYLAEEKYRMRLLNWDKKTPIANGALNVIKGFDVRVSFYWDGISKALCFVAVLDTKHICVDGAGQLVNYQELVSKYGSDSLKELRRVQGDFVLLDGVNRINTEASRHRLMNDIIPFVKEIQQLEVAAGSLAKVSDLPCRIVISEVENGTTR